MMFYTTKQIHHYCIETTGLEKDNLEQVIIRPLFIQQHQFPRINKLPHLSPHLKVQTVMQHTKRHVYLRTD